MPVRRDRREITKGNNMATLTIDGQVVQAEEGQTVLEVARKAGIDIPILPGIMAMTDLETLGIITDLFVRTD